MPLNDAQVCFRPMKQGEETIVADFVMNVFTEFVAPQYSHEGVTEFKKFVNPGAFSERLKAGNHFLLSEYGQRINGVIEMRENSHIALLFVDKFHQRRGIARELIRRSIEICKQQKPDLKRITVNSSPNAFDAYQKFGFISIEDEKVKNGIRFIPMELTLK